MKTPVAASPHWHARLQEAARRDGADAAVAIARDWLRESPGAPEPNLHLGRFHLRNQDWERAQTCLERFVMVRPGNAVAWLELGSARARRGNLDGAIEAFYTAVSCAPRSEKARARLYFALRRSIRLDESREVGAAWLRDFPGSEWPLRSVRDDAPVQSLLLGITESLKRRDNAAAEHELHMLASREGVQQLVPKQDWLDLAIIFRRHRRIATAITCCEIGLAIDPADRELLVLRGNLALRSADFGTACNFVQGLLVSGLVDDPDLWTDLALGLLQQDGCEARGRRALTEAVGRREEAAVHRDLFGNATSVVPFFGASIEQAFA